MLTPALSFSDRLVGHHFHCRLPASTGRHEVKSRAQEKRFSQCGALADKIISSVKAREENGTAYIGKLMVDPSHQLRQGV